MFSLIQFLWLRLWTTGYDEEADNGPKTWLEKFKAQNWLSAWVPIYLQHTQIWQWLKIGYQKDHIFFLFQMENLRSFKPSVFDCLFFKQSTHGVTKFGKTVRVGCLKKGLPFQLLSWRKLFSHPRPPSESPTHVEAKQQDTGFEKTSCTR